MKEIPATERHPLEPFLPQNAKILFLGSFPPPKARWSMEFFYPNWINDMWRIQGIIHFNDKHYFEVNGAKRFDKDKIESFCNQMGLAFYDTACEVRRLKENAADKFLEVVTATDIKALLAQIPECIAIVTTGEKATDVITGTFGCEKPRVGTYTNLTINERELHFWRMPSTSRAYPLSLEKKAESYKSLFEWEYKI